jgi:hypothetical protein
MFENDFNPYDQLMHQKEQIDLLIQRVVFLETRIKNQIDILQAINEQNTLVYEHLVQNATRITNLERGEKNRG